MSPDLELVLRQMAAGSLRTAVDAHLLTDTAAVARALEVAAYLEAGRPTDAISGDDSAMVALQEVGDAFTRANPEAPLALQAIDKAIPADWIPEAFRAAFRD